jgi:hypothetical protein
MGRLDQGLAEAQALGLALQRCRGSLVAALFAPLLLFGLLASALVWAGFSSLAMGL